MHTRQEHLLKALIDVDHFTPVSALAHALSCSEKTVRLDTQAINDHLKRNGLSARIAGKRGSGIRLEASEDERALLDLLVSKPTAPDEESELQRRSHALLLLACSRQRFTMESLARELFTNKQRLREDLRQWEPLLLAYHVTVSKQRRLELRGNELDVRLAVGMLAYVEAPPDTQKAIDGRFFPPGHAAFFDTLITRVEQRRGFRLSSNARRQMAVFLEVSVRRIQAGFALEPQDDEVLPGLAALGRQARQAIGVELSEDELVGITHVVELSASRWDDELIASFTPSDEARSLTARLEDALQRRFGIPVDEGLHKPLAILMELSLVHRSYRYPLPNPGERMAKLEYMERFLMLTSVIHDDEVLDAAFVSGSDCARVSLLLLEYLERIDLQRHYRAALVTNWGIDQVVYCEYRLRKLLPEIDVTAVLSEDDLPRRAGQAGGELPYEFLISFAPLRSEVPSVVISSAVNERDAQRIASVAARLDGEDRAEQPQLADYLGSPLAGATAEEAIGRLHALCAGKGLYRGTREAFTRLFYAQSAQKGEVFVFPALCADVAETHVGVHPVRCPDTSASHLAVLLVAPRDVPNLPFIVRRFKLLVELLESSL